MKIKKKITQIKNILTETEIRFQDPEDETCLSYFLVSIDDTTAEKIAEKILSKFGYKQKSKNKK